jgi:predicted phage terminase large subunit-like protein
MREKAYKWYLSTAYTRLEGVVKDEDPEELWRDPIKTITSGEVKPFEGAVVLIQTRWHEDDLAGRLLADMERGADQWDVLSLPAINDNGEALWSAKYPIERLENIKKTLSIHSPREWNSLYQQNPTPDEGNFFKREWFKRFDLKDAPEVRKYIATDYAVSEGKGDFTEFGVWGLDASQDLYAMDWWYGQETPDVWIDAELDLIVEHSPLTVYGEKGVIQKSTDPILMKRSSERRVYADFQWLARTADKAAMSQSFRARASMGKVYIPYTDWGDRLINQLCAFPSGKYDDAVDVCALIGMALDDIISALGLEPKDNKPRDRWDSAFDDDDEEDSWKVA